ncbi:hypothetical protein Tco_0852483 [Tanacetum coccineum]
MLKDNYVLWSSRLIRYSKSKPNGKLLVNSIKNDPYVRRIIHKPSDPNSVPRTILMGLPEDIYDVVDSCDTAQEIWLYVEHIMKGSSIKAQEKKAKLFNEWEMFNYTKGESIESYYYRLLMLMNDFSRNKHFPERIASNLKFLNNLQPEWKRYVTTVHQTKDLQNAGNQIRYNAGQTTGNQNGYNAIQNNANQNGNGNVVAARAESNGNGNNKNQVRCYNCRGMGYLARNCTVRPWRKDVAYLQTQLLIARKEEAGIQLQAKEFDLMAIAGDIDEIEETDQLSMEHSGGKLEQHPATIKETRAYFESSYNNLVTKVEKVNTVNRKMKQTNADLTTELARYKGQEKSFEINKAKFDELETDYRKSVYQEQCLTKKINALHLSSAKQITTLNKEIVNLNNQLSKEKSIVSLLQKENKKLKSNFKTHEDELLDKLIQSEKKIKELDNILVKTGQSIQTMHMLSPKPDSFYHTKQKMDLGYQNPFYLKQAQQKQQSLYNGRVLLGKHDHPVVYDLEETLQLAQESCQVTRKGVFLNTSKMANVSNTISKLFSIPDDDFSDDTPSVAQKFLNEVKDTIVTLQSVIKHRMNANITNWSSPAYQEFHKIFKDEITPLVNQVDA